jgi:signal transduction histidine kinase
MITPKIPNNERERLEALLTYKILDSAPEKDFDDIVLLASEICKTPISTITLIDKDRQWFKSKIGLEFTEDPRDISFCAHAINSPLQTFEVHNTLQDERFFDSPNVTGFPNIRSYAGVPLVDENGFALGTLCVIDIEPRILNTFQKLALEKLGNQVIKLLELRKRNFELVENHNLLLSKYKDLEQFAAIVSHDIKSPLNNINALTTLIKESPTCILDKDGLEMLSYIETSSDELKKLVDAILNYYKYDNVEVNSKEKIRLNDFITYLINLLDTKKEFQFNLPEENHKIYTNKTALGQILYNLISNAIKYNDKEIVVISISFSEDIHYNIISIKDNGIGVDKANYAKIFKIFETLGKKDRFDTKGTGIGLSTVEKIVQKLNGKIELKSELGIGSEFKIYLKK